MLPEAAPLARDDAGEGGGADAMEVEDLAERAVGEGTDAVHSVAIWAAPGPTTMGSSRREWRAKATPRPQLHHHAEAEVLGSRARVAAELPRKEV